ncbi:MAG: DUF92 domain-containing protein [Candidatus Diapherotrites archaeon]|nr:DUF92 domain-containing protein [Candidatus Diapherotrites archaeon]
MNISYEALYVLAILLIFSVVSFIKKLLDRDGVIIANIFGLAIYLLGNFSSFLVVVIFFAVAEFATKVGRSKVGIAHERRTIGNIVGNGMPALISLASGSLAGFYGGLSAALADTLSSEIGMLSQTKPRLITDLKREVEPGTDGGITPLGLLAGLFGALFIGMIYFLLHGSIAALGIITVCGVIGCIVDSILGATFELKGKLNNMQVNFLGSASGALLAHLLSVILL